MSLPPERTLSTGAAHRDGGAPGLPPPVLSVVVPVFNQETAIVENLRVIRRRISESLDEPFEILVVSDGSIDATEQALLAEAGMDFRLFHYDRNLGKGYAIKVGALEALGAWVGFVDADLDLDPADLVVYLHRARDQELDFAIGSKRHPDSEVHYPRSRVVASWLFQQVVRVLFRLEVRDTQVGLKLFSREVVDQVLPLVMVKRFAFDIELLAVARAFGLRRIEELPVRLEYRFSGSGVRSRAVLRAFIDVAAIFYRLRILRYYQRRRALAGIYGWTRPRDARPLVSVLLAPHTHFRQSDYANIEVIELTDATPAAVRAGARTARGATVAILETRGRAPGNWLSATVPFFARDDVSAVVSPKMAPLGGSVFERAAAAVDESRLGAGRGFFRFTPGNVRYVDDYPTQTLVVRREAFLALPDGLAWEEVVSALSRLGRVLYTPEAVIVVEPPRLFRPHLEAVFRRGRRCGAGLRRGRRPAVRAVRLAAPAGFVILAAVLGWRFGGGWQDVVLAALATYALALTVAVAAAALRFDSVAVGVLAGAGIVCTHAVYAFGFLRGATSRA
jgi:glycosyltransferase involved in cell wall biosynthesis